MVIGPTLREPLTPRELEMLALLCDGCSNEEMSLLTGIGLSTVKYHLANVFGKLGVCRRTQAVAVAVHLKLVSPDWLFGPVAAPPETVQ
jgi:LuxR family maltose regulon positive regulatory protein